MLVRAELPPAPEAWTVAPPLGQIDILKLVVVGR
jgi:hypothetical protein